MQAIMISIRPQYVAKILNREKTIEIRKLFPLDYIGWVYIYCTKGKPRAILTDKGCVVANTLAVGGNSQYKSGYSLSGRVVARFWCDKVEENLFDLAEKEWFTDMLEEKELDDYLQGKNGCVIHITKLEIFDEPKEISEFKVRKYEYNTPRYKVYTEHPLTRAPQSWQFIEV